MGRLQTTPRIRAFAGVLMAVISAVVSGCGGAPAAPSYIEFTPEKSAAAALAAYDGNGDGKLSAAELSRCPALASAVADIDTGGDKCIDAAELTAFIGTFKTGGIRLREFTPRILRGGRAVADVSVTLEPEPFMEGAVKPATGTSDAAGNVRLVTAGQPYPGAQVGFYKIVLSKKDAWGNEQLPAKFNTSTTLGVLIGPRNRLKSTIELDR